MKMSGTLKLLGVESGLRFEARFGERVAFLDDTTGTVEASPVHHLLAALAACEAMDVITILRKRRLAITAYEVLISGERAEEPPRRFLSIELIHRVTGRGVAPAEVEAAVRLSVEKYCSVYHCLRPDLPITNHVEVVEG